MWMLLFGLANLILFVFVVFFLLDRKQIKKIKFTPGFFFQKILESIKPLLIIIIIVAFHFLKKYFFSYQTDRKSVV